MKPISHLIPRSVSRLVGGSAFAVFLLITPAVHAVSLDKEGQYYFKIDCPASAIDLTGFSYENGKTNYTFSGHCSQTTNINALPNFSYTITGSWIQISNLATEIITSDYGTYSKSGLCPYDPWLDPTVTCQAAPASISNTSEVMTHMKAKLEKNHFPNSKGPFEPSRSEVLNKLLNQSLTIVQPQDKKAYDFPGQFTARVTTARLVSPAIFPNVIAILQLDEMPKWPDPNKPASSPRSFTLLNGVEHPGGNLYPRAEFPTGSTNLWDGSWLAKAHLLVADPYWTPTVSFSVGPSEHLGTPPEEPHFPDVKPTALSQLSSSAAQMSLPHRLFIVSPQTGQSVLGDVTVRLQLWGYPEATTTDGPEIELDWTWSPFSEPGEWPPTPKTMNIRSKMQGTELVIPRSAFTANGIWSLTATIKESENTSLSDTVSFKIRELSGAASQVHLNTSVHDKIKQTATLSTKQEQVKPRAASTPTLPQTHLKAPGKPDQKTQAKAIEQRVSPTALTSLKTAPTIIRPANHEHFDKTGPIQISTRVSGADTSLIWEVEYQAFGTRTFTRQKPVLVGVPAAGAGVVKTARLNLSAPGTYRFRIKEDSANALWSGWRTVTIGAPTAVAPAAKTMQLKRGPASAAETVKPTPQDQPAQPIAQPKPRTIEPSIIKRPAAPIGTPIQ